VALLCFEEHPYGRVVAQRLCEQGFVPAIAIEERSAVSAKRCSWYSRQLSLSSSPLPPTLDSLSKAHGFPRLIVGKTNSPETVAALKAASVDVVLLGGAGVVSSSVFSVPRLGAYNAHPGMLPMIRGSLPVAWSIRLGIPLGVTLHRVTEKLDCGAWVDQREVGVRKSDGEEFEDLVRRTCDVAADLFVGLCEAVKRDGKVREGERIPEEKFGPCMRWEDGVEGEAREVLKRGEYKCYVEEEEPQD